MRHLQILIATLATALLLAAGCGSNTTEDAVAPEPAEASAASGLRIVTPDEAAQIQANPPADLVILDVRTAEEFQEGHLEGAVMLDFYRDDFADELAKLDPDVPYVLYCRSGNRSGQTLAIMDSLGFTEVTEVDGGVINWQTAGLPLVTD